MPDNELQKADKTRKTEGIKVTFRCQSCGRTRPLKEMRNITRFVPALIVCSECAKALR